jgi:uncharacterized protein (DUF2141 family)
MPAAERQRRPLAATLAIACIAIAGGWVPEASAAEQEALTVRASGFTHTQGQAIAKLFQPGDNVMGNGHCQAVAKIAGGRTEFQFRGLPKGSYAVVVFHDENGNGVIDHGLLGPSEPLGFSNGFTLGLTSGFPTFGKLQFLYSGSSQVLDISVR